VESNKADFARVEPSLASAMRRLLWIVNHRTLMPAEVPILRSLGWEVFIPKIVPDYDPGYRSAAITYEYDAALRLPDAAIRVLNRHNFYERSWTPTIEDIINKHFAVTVAHFSYYTATLSEAARKFRGRLIARAFGRERPRTYAEFAEIGPHRNLLSELAALGDRFVFGQGYDNISDVEPPELRNRAHTLIVPLPAEFYLHQNIWHGSESRAVFLCPAIRPASYYGDIYDGIKRDFGDLPHIIFGRQVAPLDDPSVLPYLTDAELVNLYAGAPVFVYPHTEPRHMHYSPLEAMVVGTPTLYLRGALIDTLTSGADLPGACGNVEEMRAKTQRLLHGDRILAEAIRAGQGQVLDKFSRCIAKQQWSAVLAPPASSASEAA
jgi:glycosyltransferase involved in cell wall biosynthesis